MTEVLAVTFAYPPLAYAQSIQIGRLLTHVRAARVTVVCGDERGARQDPTILPGADAKVAGVLRIPHDRPPLLGFPLAVAARLGVPLVNKMPDGYRAWVPVAVERIGEYCRTAGYRPDVLVTFGAPMSDHLAGLELKRRHGWTWVAHFSDPWADNPFHRFDPLTKRVNLRLEAAVVQGADRLIFTSRETVRLVMAKYPDSLRQKVQVLPHSFDPDAYPQGNHEGKEGRVVRYIGQFYGPRTPRPLLDAIRRLLAQRPGALSGVRFELVGSMEPRVQRACRFDDLPDGMVAVKQPVPYAESLRLMAEADGLLVIDAPAERSVFLPSKLIDYVGAGRPVLGLTPPGAAAQLIRELGGQVADPSDPAGCAAALEAFLRGLGDRERAAWGAPGIRSRYEVSAVVSQFETIVAGSAERRQGE